MTQWYYKLSSALINKLFIRSSNDYSLFKNKVDNSIIIVELHVNNVLVTSNHNKEILALTAFSMLYNFKTEDLDIFNFFMSNRFMVPISENKIIAHMWNLIELMKSTDCTLLYPQWFIKTWFVPFCILFVVTAAIKFY